MYITTTKVFTKWINQNITKNSKTIYQAVFTEFNNAKDYEYYTGGDPWRDYDYKTGLYKAIKIIYNWDCYALPVYLTAESLGNTCNRIKRAGLRLTPDNLIYALSNELEI